MNLIKSSILLLCVICLNSCMTAEMRELTAKNNGAKFMLWTTANAVNAMEYRGPVDTQNRANGYGSYNNGGYFEGSGNFKHGQPDGDHSFRVPSPLMEGYHHYANGQHLGMTKNRNEMPQHLANVATLGLTAVTNSNNSAQPSGQTAGASGSDDGGPWYPIVWGTFGPGRPTTVGGVPWNEKTQSIRLKPGAGDRLGRLVPR